MARHGGAVGLLNMQHPNQVGILYRRNARHRANKVHVPHIRMQNVYVERVCERLRSRSRLRAWHGLRVPA